MLWRAAPLAITWRIEEARRALFAARTESRRRMRSPRRTPLRSELTLSTILVALAACSAVARRSTPAAAPAASPDAWAVVDGREIKRDDVEKAFRRVRDSSQAMSAEEEMTAKLDC